MPYISLNAIWNKSDSDVFYFFSIPIIEESK